jgi:chromosome segregation ATPase
LAGVETRLAVLEPRLESELGSTRGAVEELRMAVDAARAELAAVRGGGQAEAERLRAELATVRGAGQAEAERLRAELADQRGRLEGVPDQLRTLRELLSATREAGESGRREQQARLAEVEHAFSSTLEELRAEEQALRSALEETSHARIERLERGQSDEQQWHCAHEETTDERFARLESIVLAAVERIDVLNRRTDRDLAAIGAALEEAWE